MSPTNVVDGSGLFRRSFTLKYAASFSSTVPWIRGVHASTSRLDVSTFYGLYVSFLKDLSDKNS